MYVCKDSAAPAHARTRAHRPAAPHQSSGVSQTPHPTTACLQAGIPQTTIAALVCVIDQGEGGKGSSKKELWRGAAGGLCVCACVRTCTVHVVRGMCG